MDIMMMMYDDDDRIDVVIYSSFYSDRYEVLNIIPIIIMIIIIPIQTHSCSS